MDLKVGQKLWWVPSEHRRGEPYFVTVTKVGRVWAQLDNGYRIDSNLIADGNGYSSPGRGHRSKDEYEADVKTKERWSRFRQLVSSIYKTPVGISLADIEQAEKMLKL